MSDEASSLLDMSSEPVTLTVDGKTYEVSQLTVGDHAKAEAHLRNKRFQTLMDNTRGVPMTDESRGIAMARTLSEPILMDDLLLSLEGRAYMLWLSLSKTSKAVTLDFVKNQIPAVTLKTLTTLMDYINRLSKPDDAGPSAVPFHPPTSEATTPSSSATTGPTN